jgi:hypothetical protein
VASELKQEQGIGPGDLNPVSFSIQSTPFGAEISFSNMAEKAGGWAVGVDGDFPLHSAVIQGDTRYLLRGVYYNY